MDGQIKYKLDSLIRIISNYKSVLVAFSGGIDSTVLLKISHDILGNGANAVTVVSELLPKVELSEAKEYVEYIGVKHLTIFSNELEEIKFFNNSMERCYYCKYIRYKKLVKFAKQRGIKYVLDGTNLDDFHDFRPGIKAINELGIKTPLSEVGLNKKEIRIIAKEYKLKNWLKPSTACLASRIPYGETITKEKLDVIEKAEEYLKGLDLGQLRVRHHGKTARIEVESTYFNQVVKLSPQIIDYLKSLGYTYVTMDLEGFRSGSMNE